MRRSVLWLELPLILSILIFIVFGVVLRELRTDVVLDWFVSIAPLIWINASVLTLYTFLRLYYNPNLVPPSFGPSRTRGRVFLAPNFRAIREGGKTLRRLWVGAAIVYAVVFAFFQGMLVIDPSGSIEPISTVLDSPVGYGPGFIWAPTTTFGIVVRPFSVATAFSLSLLSGLVVALSIRLFAVSRRSAALAPLWSLSRFLGGREDLLRAERVRSAWVASTVGSRSLPEGAEASGRPRSSSWRRRAPRWPCNSTAGR